MDVSKYTTYVPGVYEYIITGSTGTVNAVTETKRFRVELKDLCNEDVVLTVNKPTSFVDTTYTLGNLRTLLDFNENNIFTLSPAIDCGEPLVSFTNVISLEGDLNPDPTEQPYDNSVFGVTQNTGVDQQFFVRQQNNKASVGTYDINFIITLASYPTTKGDYRSQTGNFAFRVTLENEA